MALFMHSGYLDALKNRTQLIEDVMDDKYRRAVYLEKEEKFKDAVDALDLMEEELNIRYKSISEKKAAIQGHPREAAYEAAVKEVADRDTERRQAWMKLRR